MCITDLDLTGQCGWVSDLSQILQMNQLVVKSDSKSNQLATFTKFESESMIHLVENGNCNVYYKSLFDSVEVTVKAA